MRLEALRCRMRTVRPLSMSARETSQDANIAGVPTFDEARRIALTKLPVPPQAPARLNRKETPA